MRIGKSNREIARSGLVSRIKAKQIRNMAVSQGWLTSVTLPTDAEIQNVFKRDNNDASELRKFRDIIEQWHKQNISAVVVHRVLRIVHEITLTFFSR